MGYKYIHKIVQNGKTRYFYTQEELAAYRKALSSKDERDAYLKTAGVKMKNNSLKERQRAVSEADMKTATREVNAINRYVRPDAPTTANKIERAAQSASKAAERSIAKRSIKARDDYERAKTVKGKAQDFSKAFNKYHPKTAKKIKKSKRYIRSLFG